MRRLASRSSHGLRLPAALALGALDQADVAVGLDDLDPALDHPAVLFRPVLRDLGDRGRTVPGEPLGFEFAALHPPGHDDLERPLAQVQVRNGSGRCDQVGGLLIGEQAIPVIHVPVELFLKRDHPAADALVFLAGSGSGELLGEGVEFSTAFQRQSRRKRELL